MANPCVAVKARSYPISTVPAPAVTVLPWLPVEPCTAAGLPLIRTVAESAPARVAPHAVGSPWRAAAMFSISTSGEPAVMGLFPWPGSGQAVGSLTRAAGLPDIQLLLVIGRCLVRGPAGPRRSSRGGGRRPQTRHLRWRRRAVVGPCREARQRRVPGSGVVHRLR